MEALPKNYIIFCAGCDQILNYDWVKLEPKVKFLKAKDDDLYLQFTHCSNLQLGKIMQMDNSGGRLPDCLFKSLYCLKCDFELGKMYYGVRSGSIIEVPEDQNLYLIKTKKVKIEEIKEWLKEKSHRELMHEFYSKNLKTRRAPSFYEKEALVIAKQSEKLMEKIGTINQEFKHIKLRTTELELKQSEISKLLLQSFRRADKNSSSTSSSQHHTSQQEGTKRNKAGLVIEPERKRRKTKR